MLLGRRSRPVKVALVVAVSLLASMGLPTGLAPAVASPPRSASKAATSSMTTAQRVAAAAAAQAPSQAPPAPEVPPGGFRGKHVVSEVLGRRTPASRTYTTAQGELLSFFWPAPIEYKDAAGTWHLVDPSLLASPGGGWHNAGDAAIAELPANLSSPIAVQAVSSTVSLGLDGAHARGSLSATTVSYPGALPGVDVSYRSQSGSLKETLTLAGPASQRAFSFTATTTAGLSISPRPDGGLGISDGEGAGVVGLSAPTMLDAAGATSHAISLTARRDGGVWHLFVVPDASWLDAPGRAWPVAVDPTVSFTESGGNDTYLSSASPTTSFGTASTFQIGHSTSSGENDRALIRFPDLGGSRLTDVKIVDASLTISQVGHSAANAQSISLYPATKAWTSSATWNTYDGTNAWTGAGGDWSTPASDTRSGGTSDVNWVFYPRAAVQSWFNFASANNGFELVSNEAVNNQMTFTSWDSATSSQWPVLSVQYTATSGLAASQSFPVTHRITDREQLKINASGNLVIAANDYSVAGVGLNFGLPRFYNSRTNELSQGFDTGKGWDLATGRQVEIDYLNDAGVDRGANFEGPNAIDDLYVPSAAPCPQYPSDVSRKAYTAPAGADADLCYDPTSNAFSLTYHASQETLTLKAHIPGSPSDYQLDTDADRNANTITYSYDVNGVWTGATDTVGRSFSVTRTSGVITSVAETNFSGGADGSGTPTQRRATYGYDVSNSYLTSFTDEAGAVTSYHYAGADNLIDKITDPVGNQITFAYDTWQRVISMTYVTNIAAQSGSTTTLTYDPNLLLKAQGDFDTGSVTGWLAGANSTLAISTSQHLDGTGSLKATSSGTSMDFSTRTGASAVPVKANQQYVSKIQLTAFSSGSTVSDVLRWYDLNGAFISSSAGPSVSDVSGSWTPAGVVATSPANAAYAAVQASYTSVTSASVHYLDDAGLYLWPGDGVTPLPHFSEGLPSYLTAACSGINATAITDPDLNPTLYCYDGSDKVTLAADPLGHPRQSTYNPDAQPTALTDALSSVTTLNYDTNANLTSLVSPASASSGATAAQATVGFSTPNPSSSCTSNCSTGYKYLPSSVTDPQSACRANLYDAVGNLTDAYANQTGACSGLTGGSAHYANKYQGDPGVASCTSDGLTTTAKGILCSMTDPSSNTTTNAYTFAASAPKVLQALAVTQPGGSCTPTHNMCQSTTNDVDMRVSSVVAATPGSTSADTKTTSCHDNNDRITKLFFTTPGTNPNCTTGTADIAYTYDTNGNLTQRADATGTTTFGYDDLGRVVTKSTGTNTCTSVVNGVTLNGTVCFGYDAAGNLTGFVDSSGTTAYAYDAANELTSLVEPGGTSGCSVVPNKNLTALCTSFDYDNNGRRTGTQYPGGAVVTATYDNAGNALSVIGRNNAGSTTLSSFAYCYRDLVSGACPTSGTITDRAKAQQVVKGPDSIQSSATTDYTYDASGRLCRAMSTAATTCPTTPPASGNAYAYDGAGNRQWSVIGATTSYYGYDADNRICWSKATTTSPGTACTPAPTGSTTYSFDNAGNLSSSASPTSSFTYNTLGQTTAITDNSVAMSAMSYADVGQSERVASTVSGSTTSYLNSPLGLDRSTTGAASTFIVRDSGGTPIGFKDASGNHWYYLTDGLGSVVGVINGDGSTLTDKYVYDEFGRSTSSTVGTAQPLGFAAGIADPTGLIKFGTRYYDPSLGRWSQADPISGSLMNPSTVNGYLYAADDPTNSADPSGGSTLSTVVGVATSFAGGIACAIITKNPFTCAAASGVAGLTSLAGGGSHPAGTIAALGGGLAVSLACAAAGVATLGVGGIACIAGSAMASGVLGYVGRNITGWL